MASRIEDYAMIGDGRTAALVARDGSIDWLCLPRFDSDSIFASLLGTGQHGFWRLAPCRDSRSERRYSGDTLVLESDFIDGQDRVRLTDFLVMGTENPTLVRRVTGVAGSMRMRSEMLPRFDYGHVAPRLSRQSDAVVAIAGADMVALRSDVALTYVAGGAVSAEFDIAAGQTVNFIMTHGVSYGPLPQAADPAEAQQTTLTFWQDWSRHFTWKTPWRDAVMRSLLTLKGMSHHPTGSIVAAPTTSLPEMPDGPLNWDYRYCWLRDASFTLAALLNAGYHGEATAWRDWMLRAIAASPEEMRIMYRLDGGRHMNEWTVDWLPGYGGAGPVRIGNSAADQNQIDVVGELLDGLELMERAGIKATPEARSAERELIGHLQKTWQNKGHGLWESRGRPEHYTYSKAMAWVGVDRFIRNHEKRHDADATLLDSLKALRRQIHDEITERSWNHRRGHFVDRYGGEHLDASLLLLPLVNFLPADDQRMAATIDAIERELSDDGLVWRKPHGGDTDQGAFIACSCWLADCRSMQGNRQAAVALLERVLSLRNDVGLLSEEYHPGLRRLMGNFPQGLSHVALVNTALGLSGPVLQRGGG